jgi:hypothetical protein
MHVAVGRRYVMAALVAALASSGATVEFEAAGISLWLPDTWNVDIEDGRLVAISPDSVARVEVSILRGAADRESAWKLSRSRLAAGHRDWIESPARNAVNGTGITFQGNGTRGGVRQAVRVLVFESSRQYLMLACSAESGRAVRSREIFERVERSIRPAHR